MAEERIKRHIVIDKPKIPKSEPRIYIFLSENFFEKTYMNHMPRTEAIKKMAKKRFEEEYGKRWEETTDEYRGYFLKTAETMLNALLS